MIAVKINITKGTLLPENNTADKVKITIGIKKII